MFEPDGTPAAGNYPAAVVWDLDGTLVESAPDLATALNTVLEAHGQSTHGVDAVRLMIGGGVPKLIERGFRAANAPLDDAEIQAIVPEFMRIYSACATNNTYLIDHAREALEHLHQAGVTQGLCTNKPISVTRKILAALEVEHYFGSVIGGDSTARRKPDPLPLLTCIENLAASPAGTVMVGDSGADVGAARAAGVRIIIVPDGYTGVPAAELGADHIVDDLRGVPARLREVHGISG
jgi:phosphoglycolate phosphatase